MATRPIRSAAEFASTVAALEAARRDEHFAWAEADETGLERFDSTGPLSKTFWRIMLHFGAVRETILSRSHE